MHTSARLVIIWIIVVNVFALLAMNRIQVVPDTAYPWIQPTDFFQHQTWNIIDLHSRWDSVWYLDIARHGYSYAGPQTLSNIAFFPLYPMLMGLLSFVMAGSTVLAGWCLSLVALVIAAHYLERLVREFHPDLDARIVVGLMLIFPTAFFFNAVYTEALFLCLSVASFYYIRRGSLSAAAILAAAAALTRVTGVLLIVPLAIELFTQIRHHRHHPAAAAWLVLIPAATTSFFIYHSVRFGDFWAWFRVESAWGRTFHVNSEHFSLATRAATVNFLLDVMFVTLAVIATVMIAKKIRWSYAAYTASTLLVALSTGTLMSIGRYALVLFPIFLLLATYRRRSIVMAWAAFSTLLLGLNIMLFVNNYWAG